MTETVNMLARFDPLAATIAEYKIENANLDFNLEDKQGMADAKSHVKDLRKVTTAIAKVHKEVKAEALAFGRAVDGKKNEYTAEVKEMIDHWALPIKEIEEREYRRMAKEAEERQAEIDRKEAERIADLEAREAAMAAKEQAVKEDEERETRERAARIAEENARIAAENEKLKAAQAKLEEEKRALEAKQLAEEEAQRREKEAREAAIKQAEIDKQNASQKAEQEIQEVIEAAEERHREQQEAEQAEKSRQEEANRKRAENREHVAKIEQEIYTYFITRTYFSTMDGGDSIVTGLIENLKNGNIPNVRIQY